MNLLWRLADSPRPQAKDNQSTHFVSVVSAWEIAIKVRLIGET